MRHTLGFAALAFAFASTAFAEERTYTIPERDVWKAGDVVTRTEDERQVQKQVVKGPDGTVMQDHETTQVTTWSGVLQVEAVDAEGRITRGLVHFSSWKRELDGKSDESLKGKHARIEGVGSARTVKVVTPGATASAGALRWLESEFGKEKASREDAIAKMFLPGKPVAVGDSWTPDMKKVAELFGEKLKLVAEKSTGKVTLVGVEGTAAVLQIEVDMPSKLETPVGNFEWTEGGNLVVRLRGSRSLDAALHESAGKTTVELKGKSTTPQFSLDLDVTSEGTNTEKPGGEMPPLATK